MKNLKKQIISTKNKGDGCVKRQKMLFIASKVWGDNMKEEQI